jgi:subtilisin-like proprotein convertase family protein
MKITLSLSTLFFSAISFCQTFNGTGGNILDNQTLTKNLTVSGLPTILNQNTFGLEQVCLDIDHTWDADVTVTLQSPDGTQIILFTGIGGDGNDFNNTCLRSDVTTQIATQGAPFNGTFKPMNSLGIANNGQNPNGVWKLLVNDNASGDQGTLNNWSITFGSNPAEYVPFTESNLPIVLINTNNQSIPDEPKLQAGMKIIDNGLGNMNHVSDAPNAYNNLIGIERRGSSSGSFPQKSYGFETRDINGTQKDTIILEMPEEHDWILYAPYDDKTCMRNIITYELANQMGHYASRTKLCELIINGQYQGIYVVMEKIKRDGDRVDISKLLETDISGDDVTGGYIFKIDKTTGNNNDGWVSGFPSETGSNINFIYHYPKSDVIVPQQQDYIQAYVDSFETALAGPDFTDPVLGYKNFSVPETFIDFFILNEISKNVDGYRLSTYIHKEKDSKGGKLRMGPMWDFNLAWWNADYCDGNVSTGWAYEFGDVCGGDGFQIPTWWSRLLEDEWYQDELKCRWTTLRQGMLSNDSLFAKIDSLALYMDLAKDRHFEQWPILGVYTWPNPSPIPADYPEEIIALKTWIISRATWLDNNIPGTCHLGLVENEIASVNAYPNPFTDQIRVSWFSAGLNDAAIVVYDMHGKVMATEQVLSNYGMNEVQLNNFNQDLSSGMYWIEIQEGTSVSRIKVVKN